MQRDRDAWIVDAHDAALRITQFAGSVAFGDYQANELLESAVERQFPIVGVRTYAIA